LNRGHHLCSAGRPSRWALAHILVMCVLHCLMSFTLCMVLMMLRFYAHNKYHLLSTLNERKFPGVSGSGEIWLAELRCTGYEHSLAECQHSGWGDHICDRYYYYRGDVSLGVELGPHLTPCCPGQGLPFYQVAS